MWIHVNIIKYILFAIMHFVYAPCQVYFENRMLTPSLASHSGRFGCVYRKCQYNGCSRISVSADLTTDTRVSAGLTAVMNDGWSNRIGAGLELADPGYTGFKGPVRMERAGSDERLGFERIPEKSRPISSFLWRRVEVTSGCPVV